MLHKFTISVNLSLDGTQEFLNSRLLTEAGPRATIDESGEAVDLQDRLDNSLPGSKRGDAAQRKTPPAVRVTAVSFSPTGRAFTAASTEGLLVYSLDNSIQFDPFNLDIDVTSTSTIEALSHGEYLKALVMAFRLSDSKLQAIVYHRIPASSIELVARELPRIYLERMIRLAAQQSIQSPQMELNLRWTEALLRVHGHLLKEKQAEYSEAVRLLQSSINKTRVEILSMAEKNAQTIEFLLAQTSVKDVKEISNGTAEEADGADEVDSDNASMADENFEGF
ncbi:hypothetical protein MRB53_038749 [Persea americana]|nr:hypothetical protein MRB53_038749 [Persea americana]